MKLGTKKLAGFTLLPVVLAMSLIAAIAFLLNRDNGMNGGMLANQMDNDRARYAAEAGLNAAHAKIQTFNCSSGYPVVSNPLVNSNFGGASYIAYASANSGSPVTLVSTGSYNGASVKLTRNTNFAYNSSPNTYTLQPGPEAGMDTYVDAADANNQGISNDLQIKQGQQNMLFKFDLTAIPTGSRSISANFSILSSSGLSMDMNYYRMTSDWEEGTGASSPLDGTTWTTKNGSAAWGVAGGDYYPTQLNTSNISGSLGSWATMDVTDIINAWHSGRYANFGIAVMSIGELGSFKYYSSDDSTAENRPKIIFNYLLPCGTTGPSDTTTVTLSPTADSFNDSSATSDNNGAATTIKTYYTPTRENRVLMQFNTSSIPTGSNVISAKLRMYVSAVSSVTSNTKSIWANAINEAWIEGVGNNTIKTCPTATVGTSWNYRTDCTNWSFIHPPDSAQTWDTMEQMPTARTNLMLASVGGKIYAVGGHNFSGQVLNTVEEFDPATNNWTTKSPMPTARSDASVAVVNGIIYVIGGAPNAGQVLNVNEAYDPATDIWSTKAALPTARKYAAAAAINNKIYVLGGSGISSYLSNNEEYDPASNTWAAKAQMPTARGYLSVESANSKIYAIGGYAGSTLAINEEFDPLSNSWVTKTPLSIPTDSMSSAAMGNKIYIIAGKHGLVITNQVWMYDALNDSFIPQLNYPLSINEPAAAALNGYIYSVGGDDNINTAYKDHYRYDPGVPTPAATASDEATLASPLAASFNGGWIDFDLKTLVQEWVDGVRPNNGLVIYSAIEDQLSINSRESTNNKPQLIVTY
jgi:N-acetylneuraminic acid mutarotase/Tfp pilus assembly protein PilX